MPERTNYGLEISQRIVPVELSGVGGGRGGGGRGGGFFYGMSRSRVMVVVLRE